MPGLVTLLSAYKKRVLEGLDEGGARGNFFFYFRVHLKNFHVSSAQKFSINVW